MLKKTPLLHYFLLNKHNGTCCRTFSLPHRQQTVFIAVAERTLSHRLKIPGVNSTTGNRVAALTHAGVVTQTPFVQVRVGESVTARNPFSLVNKYRATETSCRHVH